jgi:hypothetical protein
MSLFNDEINKKADKYHQLDTDFSNAMHKAFKEELKGFVLRKSFRLLPFEEVKEKLEICFLKESGIQSIPLASIIGSEGRYRSFTRHFFPLQEDLRDRWKKVDQAQLANEDLPPVELYRVAGTYFVKDGHHRISVARTKGKKYIDARVYDYECDVPLDVDTDLDKLAIQETYHRFLKDTQLLQHRPNADMQLTLLGGYSILMEHIEAHKHYLEMLKGVEVSFIEAVCSWYDRVYTPLVEIIRSNRIMKQFPHRTETDFYIWIIKNRRKLKELCLDKEEAARLVESYAHKYDGSIRKIISKFKRFFGLVKY